MPLQGREEHESLREPCDKLKSFSETYEGSSQHSLGCRVVGLPEVAHLPDKRTDVDDRAALLLGKIPQRGPDRVEATAQVGLDHAIPILDTHLLHRAVERNACVIDEDINAAKLSHRLLDQRSRLSRVGHIGRNRQGLG